MQVRRSRTTILLAALGLMAVSPAAWAQQQLLNKPAPDFKLPLLSGGSGALSELKGKVVLVNFFASW